MNDNELLKYLISNRNVDELCKWQFKESLYPDQEKVMKEILFGEAKRIMWSACTRYGKTRTLCKAMLFHILLNPKTNVNVVGKDYNVTEPIRDYIWELGLKSPIIRNLIDHSGSGGIDRLQKEVTKYKVTFRNGSKFQVLTTAGGDYKLMGKGTKGILWIDERALIEPDVEQTITRMLLDSSETKLIETLNPWSKANKAWDHWRDWGVKMKKGNPIYKIYHTPMATAMKENRFKQSQFDEMKHEYDDPISYEVLFLSQFPENEEGCLIPYSQIEFAFEREDIIIDETWQEVAGLDVAEMGRDQTVLTKGYYKEGFYVLKELYEWSKQETMQTVGKVIPLINKNTIINVDSNGAGSGVYSRLKEQGYKVNGIKVGEKPRSYKKFGGSNKKAEFFWKLSKLFEDKSIKILKNNRLIRELSILKYERNSNAKIVILDGKHDNKVKYNKSIDCADSLMLLCSTDQTAVSYSNSWSERPEQIIKSSKSSNEYLNRTRFKGRIT